MTPSETCARSICQHEFHAKECPRCGSQIVYTTGRTGRRLQHYEWVCPAFVPFLRRSHER